jgi:dTDP-4-dehydrorhamnose 3,5-epimerase
MIFTSLKIKDVLLIDLSLRSDERGYFTRVFCKHELQKAGIKYDIVQINRSFTKDKGMIRGMHYQKSPKAEDKIVQCLHGKIFDVAIDLRPDSETYGTWVGEVLSSENKKMLLVPKGFAHGFQAMTKNVIVEYFVSEYYAPQAEAGIRWNDPQFNISWPIQNAILSEKDSAWPDYINI